jgi:hypothetical protein
MSSSPSASAAPEASPAARPALRVILLNPGDASEHDFILRVLSGFNLDIVRSADFSRLEAGALYMYFNHRAIDLPESFLSEVGKLRGCGLLHLGDEYYRGDFRIYAHFDYVIRNSAAPFLDGPGLKQIPIGYSLRLQPRAYRPASTRAYMWSYAGALRPLRRAMVDQFAEVKPHAVSMPDTAAGETHIPRETYLDWMADTVFVPCGEGNVLLETLRPYEALEYGAIPLLPRRAMSDMFTRILGRHPLPTFRSWKAAAAFARRMARSPSALDALQQQTMTWWTRYKQTLATDLVDFIEAGRAGTFAAAHRRRFAAWANPLRPAQRMFALSRQQGIGQLGARIAGLPGKIANRGRAKEGVWTLSVSEPSPRDPTRPV